MELVKDKEQVIVINRRLNEELCFLADECLTLKSQREMEEEGNLETS